MRGGDYVREIDVKDVRHGIKNIYNDDMNAVMSNSYLRNSMELKAEQQLI